MNRFTLIAVLLTPVWSSLAQPITFTRIVDTNTQVPGAGPAKFGGFTTFQQIGVLGSHVTFIGNSVAGSGIFDWSGGGVSVVATQSTPIPSRSGVFSNGFTALVPSSAGSAFIGGNNSVAGIYSNLNGALGVVADEQTPMPGGGTFSRNFGPFWIDGTKASFFGRRESPAVQGAYRMNGGNIQTIADTNTPVPGGAGNFKTFPSGGLLSVVRNVGDSVTFRGIDQDNKTGIYRGDGGSVSKLFDTNSDGPAGEGKFTAFGSFALDSDAAIAMNATTALAPEQGIYLSNNGQVTRFVLRGQVAPGGSTLDWLGNFSYSKGTLVFLDATGGDTGNGNDVLYAVRNGQLLRILGKGDILDGGQVTAVDFRPQGQDGDHVGIFVRFLGDNPTLPVYNQAIYLVTLPTPGVAVTMAAAGLLALKRRRRS